MVRVCDGDRCSSPHCLAFIASVCLILLIAPKLVFILQGKATKRDRWTGKPVHWFVELCFGSVESFSRIWHGFEVHGIENVTQKNCLLLGYHSRPTLDIVYVISHLRSASLVSHLFFNVPIMAQLLPLGNFLASSTPGHCAEEHFVDKVTNGDRPVLLMPGGAYECAKQYKDRYKVDWKEDPGYARVLLSGPRRLGQHVKVVPFFTNNCEDVYYCPRWWHDFTGAIVRKALVDVRKGKVWLLPKLFVFGAVSLGVSVLPVPVKLDLHIGKPLTPKRKETSVQFARRVQDNLQQMIDDVRNKQRDGGEKKSSSNANTNTRASATKHGSVWWILLTHPVIALYSAFQNVCVFTYMISSVLLAAPFLLLGNMAYSLLFRSAASK